MKNWSEKHEYAGHNQTALMEKPNASTFSIKEARNHSASTLKHSCQLSVKPTSNIRQLICRKPMAHLNSCQWSTYELQHI
jgi:hypothetical protein